MKSLLVCPHLETGSDGLSMMNCVGCKKGGRGYRLHLLNVLETNTPCPTNNMQTDASSSFFLSLFVLVYSWLVGDDQLTSNIDNRIDTANTKEESECSVDWVRHIWRIWCWKPVASRRPVETVAQGLYHLYWSLLFPVYYHFDLERKINGWQKEEEEHKFKQIFQGW